MAITSSPALSGAVIGEVSGGSAELKWSSDFGFDRSVYSLPLNETSSSRTYSPHAALIASMFLFCDPKFANSSADAIAGICLLPNRYTPIDAGIRG